MTKELTDLHPNSKIIKEEGYYCKEWGCRKKGLDEFDGFCKEHKLKGEQKQ